jgi:hypothetical protein
MRTLSIGLNKIRAIAASERSLAGLFLFAGIYDMVFGATNHGAAGASLASFINFNILHLPAAGALILGLAWLSRITEVLHPHQMETVYIGSDPETVFADSTVVEKHHHRKPAAVVPKPHHPEWEMADSIYTDLAKYHWIADEQSITQKEAVNGGKYIFERKFMLPHELENLVSAELMVLVARWCRPTVNGHVMERKGGEVDLITWDLSNALQSGENHITFEVEHEAVEWVAGDPELSQDPRWKEWNPYGLKYLIRVTHPV